jgi:3-methyladenine DNA glycosylase AlkD
MSFISSLQVAFGSNANKEDAYAMAKYMKNKFVFFGIKTKPRRLLLKSISKEYQEEIKQHSRTIVTELIAKKEREFHYCAVEIIITELKKNYQKEDIHLIQKMLTTHSWWDSVDIISKHILGNYLLQYPEQISKVITEFATDENMWLNRSAILFQLGYKTKTDFQLLKRICLQHKDSNQFFIQKAIGWALREYAKTNPEAVKEFVLVNNLKPLSQKEALKNLSVA